MDSRGSGDPGTDELIAAEPGLDRLVSALTADGDATELVARQSALTMFRTLRATPAAGAGATGTAAPGTPGPTVPASVRKPRARVLVATAALVAIGTAATVAAYAAALPAPVQQIAHNVLAPLRPLGVPAAPPPGPVVAQPPAPGQRNGPGSRGSGNTGPKGSGQYPGGTSPSGQSSPGASGTPSNGATQSPGASPSGSASSSPTASPGAASLTLAAARGYVPAGGQDRFTASLTQAGQPVPQVTVRLVERDADAAAPKVVAAGVTSASGVVTFTVTGLARNATFTVAGTAQFAATASATVAVQVVPALVLSVPGPGTLAVRAQAPAAPGDVVVLQLLSAGGWGEVTARALGSQDGAAFPVKAGQTYRVVLRATAIHARAVSALLTA
jgi:hypothetical protein